MLNQISSQVIMNGQEENEAVAIRFVTPPVYEVIRVVSGRPLFLHEHYERLVQSSIMSDIQISFAEADLLKYIDSLVERTGILNNNVRLEVGKTDENQISWVLFWVHSVYPDETVYKKGVKVVTYKAERENPHAKIYRSNFADTILELRKKHDAFEVLLVREDHVITEGSRSNLFFIKNDVIYSAKESDVLQGITRMKLIELMQQMGIKWIEMDILVSEIDQFEACFITGTSVHILPVSQINTVCYESAKHPLLLRLEHKFKNIVLEDLKTR